MIAHFPLMPKLKGFTLVEMAMVLAIITLLLTGLVPTISSQFEQRKINETKAQLLEIQQALIGYALINGRLPCPAQASLATGSTDAGIEASNSNTCTCVTAGGGIAKASAGGGVACSTSTSVTGVLPWATLGIAETDAWNRRFTYRVTTHFADAITKNTLGTGCTASPPAASSFALCSKGVPDVRGAGGTNIAIDVPAVFVSHGTNGAGAFLSNGTQLTVSSNSDEADNSDTNDTQFVSHEFTTGYDDLVGWISPGILINRMVAAGKLP